MHAEVGVRGSFLATGLSRDAKTIDDLSPGEHLPPAEQMPTITSLDEAKRLLALDRALTLKMIHKASEDDLMSKEVAAPWAKNARMPLGRQLLQMVQHLDRHKTQLFYYLKLQGKPISTVDLWGS
ncbi:MAG: DinB family protein [Candidatus Sulfotelmatobacter sp.]